MAGAAPFVSSFPDYSINISCPSLPLPHQVGCGDTWYQARRRKRSGGGSIEEGKEKQEEKEEEVVVEFDQQTFTELICWGFNELEDLEEQEAGNNDDDGIRQRRPPLPMPINAMPCLVVLHPAIATEGAMLHLWNMEKRLWKSLRHRQNCPSLDLVDARLCALLAHDCATGVVVYYSFLNETITAVWWLPATTIIIRYKPCRRPPASPACPSWPKLTPSSGRSGLRG